MGRPQGGYSPQIRVPPSLEVVGMDSSLVYIALVRLRTSRPHAWIVALAPMTSTELAAAPLLRRREFVAVHPPAMTGARGGALHPWLLLEP